MPRPLIPFFLLSLFPLLHGCGRYQASAPPAATEKTPNEISERFLLSLRSENMGQAEAWADTLATYDPGRLAAALDTRNEKLAFWVNIYNGMVQYLLMRQPELYEDRGNFFKTPRFTVAGHELSPDDVEHGIIRGGENKLGLGFLPQIFTDKFQRTFAVDGGDARVHFALNCGAKSCPPVEIYRADTYDQQINQRVRSYLADHSRIETRDGERVLITSPLFSWFRGDFRQYDGIDDFLVEYDVLQPEEKNIDREYEDYDWTLETGIWAG